MVSKRMSKRASKRMSKRASKSKRSSKRKSVKGKKSSKKPNALTKLQSLSADGQSFFNQKTISRAQAQKKIWDYIKSKNLQDKSDGRIIHADAKLAGFLGLGSKFHMMKIAGALNKHFK